MAVDEKGGGAMRQSAVKSRFPKAVIPFRSGKKDSAPKGKRLDAVRKFHLTWHRMALSLLVSETIRTPAVLGITSAGHGEGKTINCLALVTALARETDARVLMVECDLASRSVALEFDMDVKPGLVEYIAGECSIEEARRPLEMPNLEVLVAGGEENPEARWEPWREPTFRGLRRRLPGILEELKQTYSYIVVDMPPVLTNPYATEMAASMDGAFLAVRTDYTALESVNLAVNQVGDEKLLGVILVGAYPHMPGWLTRLLSE